MKKEEIKKIENIIGYEFCNEDFLIQAFTRKSFSKEHGGEDNEILEFIGDKVLDFYVVKLLITQYMKILNQKEFKGLYSKFSEGKLTEIKKRLVEKKMLAKRIDDLKLNVYLRMGNGDKIQNIQNQESVKEDLFEAIIGAVAIDSEWDNDYIEDVIDVMLRPRYFLMNGFEDNDNYIGMLQEWFQKEYGTLPEYVEDKNITECNGEFIYKLNLDDNISVTGKGKNKTQAKMDAAKKFLEYIQESDLLLDLVSEIGEPNFNLAINQLQELFQKNCISKPKYEFFQTGIDENGNPLWKGNCSVDGFVTTQASGVSKKIVKKKVAYKMLTNVLESKQ